MCKEEVSEEINIKNVIMPNPKKALILVKNNKQPVSFKKVGPTNRIEDETINPPSNTGYRLVDMKLLTDIFSSLRCPKYGNFTLAL